MPDVGTCTCYRINAPELYTDELLSYIDDQKPGSLATWQGQIVPFGEWSDIFITIDGDDGSNSDMPAWAALVALCKQIDDHPEGLIWLSNL